MNLSRSILHIRHFVVVTPKVDIVSRNLVKMLSMSGTPARCITFTDGSTEPGGYLQWSEFDLSRARIYKAQDHFNTSALERMCFPYDEAKPGHLRTRQTWVQDLRSVLEKQGLETVVEERRRPNPYYRNASFETSIMSYFEMSFKAAVSYLGVFYCYN